MLTLPIKRKWYDMILSGEKKEEYRNINNYYTSRFNNAKREDCQFSVVFRNGYSNTSPSFIADVELTIGRGKPQWGADPLIDYYILRILDIKK